MNVFKLYIKLNREIYILTLRKNVYIIYIIRSTNKINVEKRIRILLKKTK